MLFVRKNFMVWRRLLRTLAAFFRLRTMLGFSKKRRRRTSLKMRSPCTTLLNRFKADSNDSLSSTTTRVKKLTPLWFVICKSHYNRRTDGCQTPLGLPVHFKLRARLLQAPVLGDEEQNNKPAPKVKCTLELQPWAGLRSILRTATSMRSSALLMLSTELAYDRRRKPSP
jgi:hypothetical protein